VVVLPLRINSTHSLPHFLTSMAILAMVSCGDVI